MAAGALSREVEQGWCSAAEISQSPRILSSHRRWKKRPPEGQFGLPFDKILWEFKQLIGEICEHTLYPKLVG